jgi:hypothetical protein
MQAGFRQLEGINGGLISHFSFGLTTGDLQQHWVVEVLANTDILHNVINNAISFSPSKMN